MTKIIYTILLMLSISLSAQSQIVFEENFETGSADGWTIESNATDGGWIVGTANALASQAFGIPNNGSNQIAATNDDACNCNKSDEAFITPAIELTGVSAALLKFDAVYLDNTYQGNQEDGSIAVSTDGGVTYEVIADLEGETGWATRFVDLTAYVGQTINIAFNYDDGSGWLYGFAIDNVTVEVPALLDARMESINSLTFGEVNTPFPIRGMFKNEGASTITELEFSYTIGGGAPTTETLSGLNIASFDSYAFETSSEWLPDAAGTFDVDIDILTVNGMADEDDSNNGASIETEIFDQVIVPNKIPDFLNSAPIMTEVEGASSSMNSPTDLDFFPILGKNELWVINQRSESVGGSTVKISDATDETPSNFLEQVDGNAWHFMSLPTGIAFSSDNFNFANSPGVQDANHGGEDFTGPSLWSSDPEIYAQPSGGNGSHLDMLHGSPFSMGIAHEVDNVFWIYDDWNNDIVRYDFVEDHGPGADDHSDGIIRRYRNIGIAADGDIPNHMIVDKASGWLYFVDNGNDRVMRLDINSGSSMTTLPLYNEPLAEHSSVNNFTVETIIETGLDRPCGIEIFENRLLVGDFANGDIIIYDMDNDFVELGRIATGEEGLTGIKMGPDGNIWYTNIILNRLMNVQPGDPTNTSDLENNLEIRVSPNPATDLVQVIAPYADFIGTVTISVTNLAGQSIMNFNENDLPARLDLSNVANGLYFITVQGDGFKTTEKLTIQR